MKHWRLLVVPLTIACSILLLWIPLKDDDIRLEHATMATLTIPSSRSEEANREEVSEEAGSISSPTETPPAPVEETVSPVPKEEKPSQPATTLPSLPTMAMLAEQLPTAPIEEEPEPAATEEALPEEPVPESKEEEIPSEEPVSPEPSVEEESPSTNEEVSSSVESNPSTVSEEDSVSSPVPVESAEGSSAESVSSPSSGTDEVMIGGYHVLDGNTVPPVYRNVKLGYPSMAKRRNIEGSAEIEVYVSERGKIDKVVLVHASREEFGEAALKAFKKAKAEPATKDGKAIAVVQRIPVRFSLK